MTLRELTGDMQRSKNELEETQMIVATPKKWDVITHKSSDMSLLMLSTQTMICIVGLSATLPNYLEVATVSERLFFFNSSYRPVHLAQQYIGISEQNFTAHIELQNEICYKKFVESLRKEVALGTVTNVKEACEWLGYTYLFIRMRLNPLVYGIEWDEVFYVDLTLPIWLIAHSSEIENIVVRDEEQNELETLVRSSCPLEVKLYRSRGSIDTFLLVSDAAYISASLALIMLSHFIKFID
ncbi:unnamed protein product [Prunus brigantina]